MSSIIKGLVGIQALKYRAEIDGLRAVAISSVLAFHSFPRLLPGGFLGVDVFFVISGFLIAGIVLHEQSTGTFTLANFYRRRVRRIFPALIAVLLTCLGTGMLCLFDVEFLQLARHAFFGAFGLANLSLYNDTGYFSLAAETNPLLHLWSLGVEEQFYLLLPLLVLTLGGRKRYLLMAFLTIFAGSLWLSVDPFGRADAASKFYLPQYRAWELMAGVLLAYVARIIIIREDSFVHMVASNAASIVGLGLLLFGFLYFDSTSPQWLANGTVVVGTVFLIAAGIRSGISRYVLSIFPVVFIGIISYPLYLWHWPLLVFGRLLAPELGMVSLLALISSAVALAYLTWRYVETPIRGGKWELNSPRWLAFAMANVAGLACFIFLQDGRVGWAEKTSPLSFHSVEGIRAGWVDKIGSLTFLAAKRMGDKRCVERYWGKDRPENVYTHCSNFAPTAGPSVVVIGDSHALHLYEGLRDYYTRKGDDVLALTVSGCALTPEPPVRSLCADAYDQIFRKVEDLTSVDTVVLGEYVPYFASNNRPNWASLTRERIVSLTSKGRKVVLMLDIPDLEKNPRQYCYSRLPIQSSNNLMEKCSILRKDYEKRVVQYRENAAEAVKGLAGVVLFDLASVLCGENTCRGINDDQPLYSDGNHLNYYGSLYVSRFYDWEKVALDTATGP